MFFSCKKYTKGVLMQKIITAITVFLIALTLVSCSTSNTKTTETEELEIISVEPESFEEEDELKEEEEEKEEDKGGWLTALGNIEGLDVKKFRLRGEGPEGASFGWVDVKGSKVALSDIRRGEWDLYAQALGENNEILATGHLKTFLSDATPLGTLFLSEETGTGSVSCNLRWTTTQVIYPSLEIYMKTENGEFMSRSNDEITINENGYAVWNAKNIPAGSYIVRMILKDEGEIVSGIAAALRVIDKKVSVGDCRFVIGKLSTVYGIDLQNAPLDTVHGEIVLENGILNFVSETKDLKYVWFMDGEIMPEHKNLQSIDVKSLNLEKGFYRFDCVASDIAGFTSINTNTAFVYTDGKDTIVSVTDEQADSKRGDIPEGYTEVFTVDSPTHSAEITFHLIDESTPVNTETETNSNPIEIETQKTEKALWEAEIDEILEYLPEETVQFVISQAQTEAEEKNLSEEECKHLVLEKLRKESSSLLLERFRNRYTTSNETSTPEPEAETEEILTFNN